MLELGLNFLPSITMASLGRGCDEEELELEDEPGNYGETTDHRQPFLAVGFACEAGTRGGRNHHRFLDRSKVRILLCDGDEKSSREVSDLLCKCSYQVVPVKTARQVIDSLNAQGSEIDIILSEVDLPVSKGFKMLRYIMRNPQLQRIPIVMMSARDEVSVVVKCLRLGVADYLVKPLRRNELLNLWIHVWRRRRALDLPEKHIWGPDVDALLSDASEGNTNNSTFLSDEMDKPLEAGMPKNQLLQVKYSVAVDDAADLFDVQEEDECTSGRILSCPKKSELKVGKSSAFLTYVKSSLQVKTPSHVPLQEQSRNNELHIVLSRDEAKAKTEGETGLVREGCSSRGSFAPHRADVNQPSGDPSNIDPRAYQVPYYVPRMLTQVPAIPSFPYYQVALGGGPPDQVGTSSPQMWASIPRCTPLEQRTGRVERREAALLKFRQKRKDRCFDKKIRYVNRKRLAERRPRNRGQFVRLPNGASGELNKCHAADGEFEDEEDDYDDDDGDDDEGQEESASRDVQSLPNQGAFDA